MAVHPFRDLPRVMRARSNQVVRSAGRITRKAATVIDREVVQSTPVDTGKARSNWLASLNIPLNAVIPPYSPGRHLGVAETANAGAAIAQAAVPIASFNPTRDRAIFLTNNVFYVGLLNNDETSTQAPRFFIQTAVRRGIEAVRSERIFRG